MHLTQLQVSAFPQPGQRYSCSSMQTPKAPTLSGPRSPRPRTLLVGQGLAQVVLDQLRGKSHDHHCSTDLGLLGGVGRMLAQCRRALSPYGINLRSPPLLPPRPPFPAFLL